MQPAEAREKQNNGVVYNSRIQESSTVHTQRQMNRLTCFALQSARPSHAEVPGAAAGGENDVDNQSQGNKDTNIHVEDKKHEHETSKLTCKKAAYVECKHTMMRTVV